MSTHAVFDCMIFLQAMAGNCGASFRCFERVFDDTVIMLTSTQVLEEVEDVVRRPELRRKWPILTDEHIDAFLLRVTERVSALSNVPHAFSLPRDPDDEIYLDLAIAARADYLVTWNDRHLTYLMRQDTPEGKDFCAKFPFLKIVDPPTFLRESAPPTT